MTASGLLYGVSSLISSTEGRLYSMSASVSVTAGRLYSLSANVPLALDVTVTTSAADSDPYQTVTVTGSVPGGISGVTYAFSAPGVTLSGSGASRTFQAPGTLADSYITITVTASAAGYADGVGTAVVHIYPHIEWGAKAGVWRPERVTQY